MSSKVFVIRIPAKIWSKHDDPKEAASALEDMAKKMLQIFRRSLGGESPFDENGVRVSFEEDTSKQ